MVHQVFELVRIIAPLVHKMDEKPRVEITAACPHHDAASRREAHAGIERLTICTAMLAPLPKCAIIRRPWAAVPRVATMYSYDSP